MEALQSQWGYLKEWSHHEKGLPLVVSWSHSESLENQSWCFSKWGGIKYPEVWPNTYGNKPHWLWCYFDVFFIYIGSKTQLHMNLIIFLYIECKPIIDDIYICLFVLGMDPEAHDWWDCVEWGALEHLSDWWFVLSENLWNAWVLTGVLSEKLWYTWKDNWMCWK